MTVFLALVGYPFTINLETEQQWIDLRIRRLFRKIAVSEDAREAWRKILTKVVLTVSDLQLATGLAIIAIAFSVRCSISVYHFAVVSDMTWFTLGTHNTTLWLLRDYFRERRLLLCARIFLMACLASVMTSAVILQGHKDSFANWNCKAQCMFGDLHGNIGGYPGMWMSLQLWWIIESFVFAARPHFPGPASLFQQWFYYAPRNQFSAWSTSLKDILNDLWTDAILFISSDRRGLLTLPFLFVHGFVLVATWLILRGILLVVEFLNQYWTSVCWNLLFQLFWLGWRVSSVIQDHKFAEPYLSGSENDWGFGQLLQMLLLALPVIAAIGTIVDSRLELKAKRSKKGFN